MATLSAPVIPYNNTYFRCNQFELIQIRKTKLGELITLNKTDFSTLSINGQLSIINAIYGEFIIKLNNGEIDIAIKLLKYFSTFCKFLSLRKNINIDIKKIMTILYNSFSNVVNVYNLFHKDIKILFNKKIKKYSSIKSLILSLTKFLNLYYSSIDDNNTKIYTTSIIQKYIIEKNMIENAIGDLSFLYCKDNKFPSNFETITINDAVNIMSNIKYDYITHLSVKVFIFYSRKNNKIAIFNLATCYLHGIYFEKNEQMGNLLLENLSNNK